jgi:hypothetical protein
MIAHLTVNHQTNLITIFLLTKKSCPTGVRSRGDVAVIAATNRPDNIDPALLRPGIVHFVIMFLSLALLHGHPNTLRKTSWYEFDQLEYLYFQDALTVSYMLDLQMKRTEKRYLAFICAKLRMILMLA